MNSAFESLKQGLREAIDYSEGRLKNVRVYKPTPVDIKQLRKRVGMTQLEFSSAFGISIGTLRHWERGDRTPKGSALVLLNLVQKEPHTILRVLSQ